MNLKNLILLYIGLFFVIKGFSQEIPLTLIQKMSCSDLTKEISKNEPLKGLFIIRYLQKCPAQEEIQLSALSDFEKQIYWKEIQKLNSKPPIDSPEVTIDDLKLRLQQEVNPENKFKLFLALRQKYKNEQRNTDTEKTVQQLYTWAQKQWLKKQKNPLYRKVYIDAISHKARYLWNQGKLKSAIQLINSGLKIFKKDLVIDFYFLKGRIYEDLKKTELAFANYKLCENALKKNNTVSELVDLEKILWIQAWLYYKNKNYSKSVFFFDQLILETKEPSEKSRALFFKAQSYLKLNKKEAALDILEQNSKDDQYSFYSLVSALHLNKKIQFATEKSNLITYDKKLPFLTETQRNIFQKLIQFEESEILEKSVPYYTSNLTEQIQLSMQIARSLERYQALFSVFSQLSIEQKMSFLKEYKELVFPTPYLKKVKSLSEQYQVPVSLVYSLMKQESSFNPVAQSAANAFGLMQVIPSLALQIQKKNNLKMNIPDDLFNPEKNIELGIIELKEQIRKQNNQLILVAAAYNAGPTVLKKWVSTALKNKWDIYEFIEEIPYDETRTYVKIMARNLMYYDSILKNQNPNTVSQQFLNWPPVSK